MTIIIYSTFKNRLEAEKIITHLLNKKLVACANLFPIKSIYFWKSRMVNNNEVAALLKTTEKNWTKIKNEIKKLHSYEVPCIEKIKVETEKNYGQWIKTITG